MKKYSEQLKQREFVEFIVKGRKMVIGGRGKRVQPPTMGFMVWDYREADKVYRMYRTGYEAMHIVNVVTIKKSPVWMSHVRGGMKQMDGDIARGAFRIMNKILILDNPGFASFRGPETVILGKWKYEYSQKGDVDSFSGKETLKYDKELVYSADVIGGIVEEKKIQ